MSEHSLLQIKDSTANPAPLGLFGFGMTTILLNLCNAHIVPLTSTVLAMGICYGGSAQVIAGVLEWKKNNTFGATAFTSYGFFWLSLVVLLLLPKIGVFADFAPENKSMGAYLIMWGIFTFGLLLATFRMSLALVVVFASLTLLFFLLAGEHLSSAGDGYKLFTGYEGIFCGASAMYTGLAHVLNETYGFTMLPLGICNKK